jgi:hypothetical protein
MTASDSGWLSFFSTLAIIGCVIVIIGVVLESAELIVKFSSEMKWRKWVAEVFGNNRRRTLVFCARYIKPRLFPFEFLGFSVLVIGLGIELLGSFSAERLQSKENSVQSFQTELLRSNNIALQLKLQPRTITAEQIANFIYVTQKIPKFQIRIGIGEAREETASYAWQIRRMFDAAKFPTPNSDTNLAFGIYYDPGAVSLPTAIGDTNKWPDVEFVTDSTNDFRVFNYSMREQTNGFVRFTIKEGDTNNMYGAFINALIQVGINVDWNYNTPKWVAPNHCAIFVKQKPQ